MIAYIGRLTIRLALICCESHHYRKKYKRNKNPNKQTNIIINKKNYKVKQSQHQTPQAIIMRGVCHHCL